jgi:O-antigen/teichoic acid export membrane protein
VGAAGCVVLGPWAADVLFNTAQRPSTTTLALLGAATVLMLVAMVMQPTLVALGRQQVVTVAWSAGTAVFLVLLVLPVPPITAALVAQLVGPLVVAAVLTGAAVRALRGAHPGVAAAAPQVG